MMIKTAPKLCAPHYPPKRKSNLWKHECSSISLIGQVFAFFVCVCVIYIDHGSIMWSANGKAIPVWLHTTLMCARLFNCVYHTKKKKHRMCKNVTAFLCLRVHFKCHLPRSIVATTDWMKQQLSGWQGSGVTQAQHLLLLPAHPPQESPTHPPASSRHRTNTYDSQQQKLHKSCCSSIEFTLLLLFWGLCSASILLVG